MGFCLLRIDERLVHGKVINEWISFLKPTHLVIVDDQLAKDDFMSKIYKALVPIYLKTYIIPQNKGAEFVEGIAGGDNRVFVIVRDARAALAIVKKNGLIEEINFGDKKYRQSKSRISMPDMKAVNDLLTYKIKMYAIDSVYDEKISMEEYKFERS